LRSSEEYQAHAVECLRLAQAIEFPDSKAMLLEMAQAWVRLAQHAREKEGEKVSS
jgi:hypothetical protein